MAGCAESRAGLAGTHGTHRTQGPGSARGERSRHHREGGWVRGGGPGPGPGLPHPRRSRARSAPAPGPQTQLLPSTAPSPGPAPPALPRVRSNGTFSSPLSFRPARNRHTAPIRIRWQASGGSPGSGPRPSVLPQPRARGRQGPGMPAAGVGGEGSAGLPRIRRFFSERPRPIAAILTGFSHNTGNLAQSRENPFPSPRAAPAPRGIFPAPRRRRLVVAVPSRAPRDLGADPEPGRNLWLVRPSPPAAGGCGHAPGPAGAGISHEGSPIDASLQRGDRFPSGRRGSRGQSRAGWEEAGMWPAGHLLKPSCVTPACFQALGWDSPPTTTPSSSIKTVFIENKN